MKEYESEENIMKILNKVLAMGLAAMMAVSAMNISVFAAEDVTNKSFSKAESVEVDTNNEKLEYVGRMLVVYNGDEVSDMIPIDNEEDALSIEIEEGTANIYTEDGTLVESAELPAQTRSNTSAVSARALFIYRVTGNDVCLRKTFPNGAVVDYLQNGMLFGSESFSTSGWLYGYVVDDLGYYSYSINGWWGYVYGAYLANA